MLIRLSRRGGAGRPWRLNTHPTGKVQITEIFSSILEGAYDTTSKLFSPQCWTGSVGDSIHCNLWEPGSKSEKRSTRPDGSGLAAEHQGLSPLLKVDSSCQTFHFQTTVH